MRKNKLLYLVFLTLLISCTKKNKIEAIFITPKDHYWQWSNTQQYNVGCGEINFKFEKNGYSHRYNFNFKKGYILHEGQYDDIIIGPKKWYLKNDSTLVWDNLEYKIEHIDNTVIMLSYFLPSDKKQQCWTRLLKVVGEK
ncbi:hypothetical protein [Flavobacterium gyeonganense]|uniref:Lipocalin-like domain-containing protein n=1 Tax=Flavobacterium gyeonganense TaxID=1310418 RepID=A0ABV5HAM8_9FLAO|nr:hypothetical protein [Flavobacterium gyeonganense]